MDALTQYNVSNLHGDDANLLYESFKQNTVSRSIIHTVIITFINFYE